MSSEKWKSKAEWHQPWTIWKRDEKNLIFNTIQKNKILGINLSKDIKDLYTGNYKMLLK